MNTFEKGEAGRLGGPGGAWVRGAALLGGAALVSKAIGTLQKIPLQNVAGDRVFGLYNAVYPFYQLLLFLAAAGIPTAVSLIVAERMERGDAEGGRRLVRAAVVLLGLTGAAGFALMWTGADGAAAWIGDRAAAAAVQASAAALWFIPVMAALRGYFQGLHRMEPSAVSQVVEQTVRVAAMLILLGIGWQAGWSDGSLAAGAAAGSAFGGAAGLAVMALWWRRIRAKAVVVYRRADGLQPNAPLWPARDAGRKGREGRAGLWPEMKRLAAVGLPAALGSIAVPVAGIVDAFTVPRLLAAQGASAAEAMTAFGLYSRGQPLVQLVVMVAGAVAGALVPVLATASARGDLDAVRKQASLAVRTAWWTGAAAAVGLVLLADPLNVALYADHQASGTFAVVCGTAWAATVSAVSAAVLQGLGRAGLSAAMLLLGALLKAALNLALVPALGIAGAAWAGVAAFTAAAL
ncbi:membrane protein, partial [Paenibacillus darwinianus]